ncbi:Fe-S cluster-binding ABC transporter [uncultured virus]|nr:Fe-S cluster-binding ABC transporter [uncultured virus]
MALNTSHASNKRIAIVDTLRCKPHKCKRECEKYCPVNAQGRQCITHTGKGIAEISEELCTGCNICTKKCPFGAISIINLPTALGTVTHRYSANGFQLYGLPMPEKNSVLGLVGANGCGKTSAILILIGELIPNLGNLQRVERNRRNLNLKYRGTNVQNYLTELDKGLKIGYKPQNIQSLRDNKVLVGDLMSSDILQSLDLEHIAERNCHDLSDGELQRVSIGIVLSKDVDVLVFDEPCTYLDIHQRMAIARLIQASSVTYKIVIEHDFTALDYMADKICLLYGSPGAFGNVTLPMTTAEGLNCFLDGFIAYSNTRFRSYALDFKFSRENMMIDRTIGITYPAFTVSYTNFTLTAIEGSITSGSITVLLGPNGSGKTTFIRTLSEKFKGSVACKEQNTYLDSPELVLDFLMKRTNGMILDVNFKQEVMNPLHIDHLMDRQINTLSGGEMQKVALIATLGQTRDIYLIDEPSCYLDIESVLVVAKILKRFVINNHKYMFVVEHDFNLGIYLADNVLLFNQGAVSAPVSALSGFNQFLQTLEVTMRRDYNNYRPRINKPGSRNDTLQKQTKNFIESTEASVPPKPSFPLPDVSW